MNNRQKFFSKKSHKFLCLFYIFVSTHATASTICEEGKETHAYSKNELSIGSGELQYDGGSICLKGHVVIDHDLGKISANQLLITPEKSQKNIKLNDLTMTDHVIIKLKDGAQLNCSYAHIDYQALAAVFAGDEQNEFVIFNEDLKVGTREIPLTVKSYEMTVQIERQERLPENLSSEIHLQQESTLIVRSIVADGQVIIDYNHDITATANHADYQRHAKSTTSEMTPAKSISTIMLTGGVQNEHCEVKRSNGDQISSKNLKFDLSAHELIFTEPKGKLAVSLDLFKSEEIDAQNALEFSADKLILKERAQMLSLEGNIMISQKGFGTLTTNQYLDIQQHTVNNKKCIQLIKSQGETILTYLDPHAELFNKHTLTCYGTLLIDHEHSQTMMNSPMDEQGKVSLGKQIRFQDHLGELYADTLLINYEELEGVSKIKSLSLEGNIRILNRPIDHLMQNERYLQFALADRIEYTPEATELRLFAYEGKRVLFIDRLNNVNISAPALTVKRDESTHKESIDGIGNVRFSLLEQEMSQILKMFPELNKDAG